MTISLVTTSSLVSTSTYNSIYNVVYDILGPGEDGYGITAIRTAPVGPSTLMKAYNFANLNIDIAQTIYQHIASSIAIITGTQVVSTTTLITTSTINEVVSACDYIQAHRYECHENNYALEDGKIYSTYGGTSIRTTPWYREIVHKVNVSWGSRLLARYFFNTGGMLGWAPFRDNVSEMSNQIDIEWATLIDEVYQTPINYTRDIFVSQLPGSTITLYQTGSGGSFPDLTYTRENTVLGIQVQVRKGYDEKSLEFIATFVNKDISTFTVTPTGSSWNLVVV